MPEDGLITCAALDNAAAPTVVHPVFPADTGSQEVPLLSGPPARPRLEGARFPCEERIMFQEVLDHSSFGGELHTEDSADLVGHVPVRPSLRPTLVSPDMPNGGSYTMALSTDPPRRSGRLATPITPTSPQVNTVPLEDNSDTESDEIGWDLDHKSTQNAPRDKHVIAWLARFTRFDRHVPA